MKKGLISGLVLVIISFTCSFSKPFSDKRNNFNKHEETIPIWPDGKMPAASISRPQEDAKQNTSGNIYHVAAPYLVVHRPSGNNNNHHALLIISGGGYKHIVTGNESRPAAEWLSNLGYTTFELIYRLPADGWEDPFVPLADGQRAIRVIKSLAPQFDFEKSHLGVMGFSAGGHLAGMLLTSNDRSFYNKIDDIDAISTKLEFGALLYPVVSMIPPYNTTNSFKEMFAYRNLTNQAAQYSVELLVTSATPPMFLAQAKDDPISPVQNSELLYKALQRNGNTASVLHLFETGGHGWGLGKPGSETVKWPDLFIQWVQQNRL